MPKLRSRSVSASRSREASRPQTPEEAVFEAEFEGALENSVSQPSTEGGRVFWENEFKSLKASISQYTRENSAIIESLISENRNIRETIKKNHEELSQQLVPPTDKKLSFKASSISDSSDSDSDSDFQIPRETLHDPPPLANKGRPTLRAEKRAKLLAEAYKISKNIVTLEASADNIEAWVPASFNALREVFPSLPCADVLKVLCKRLPKEEIAYIERITCGIDRMDVFCDILKSVYGKGCRGGSKVSRG